MTDLSYTNQGTGKLEPPPPGYTPSETHAELPTMAEEQARKGGVPLAGFHLEANVFCGELPRYRCHLGCILLEMPRCRWHLGCILLEMPAISMRTGAAPKSTAVHTATLEECAARVPSDAYGFQWDCNGTRESKACIVLQTPSDCATLHASGCQSQVYINSSRALPKPAPPGPAHDGPHWPEGTGHP